MFCWTDFSHQGAKSVVYQGLPIVEGFSILYITLSIPVVDLSEEEEDDERDTRDGGYYRYHRYKFSLFIADGTLQ